MQNNQTNMKFMQLLAVIQFVWWNLWEKNYCMLFTLSLLSLLCYYIIVGDGIYMYFNPFPCIFVAWIETRRFLHFMFLNFINFKLTLIINWTLVCLMLLFCKSYRIFFLIAQLAAILWIISLITRPTIAGAVLLIY